MKKVIFDVDGVLLSEKRYFDVSALTLWEWYNSPFYMGLAQDEIYPDLPEEKIDEVRAYYWKNDEILQWLKSHGINDNWDMVHAHLFVTLWLMLEDYTVRTGELLSLSFDTIQDVRLAGKTLKNIALPTAEQVLEILNYYVPVDAGKDAVYEYLEKGANTTEVGRKIAHYATLGSPLWHLHQDCFQAWYFGDDLYQKIYERTPVATGKSGFLNREEPLGTVEGILHMFQELKKRGYDIAIATGRSYWETRIPFETYGWLDEFDPLYISTSTDVKEAGELLGLSLQKPHPFAYFLGAFGHYPEQYRQYVENPDAFKKGTYYVVGDSLSDVWGAQKMGAIMIGTLTGLDGEAARAMFEREKAEYILDSVEQILDILL